MRIISIIIILALFGAIGYLFYQNMQFKELITKNKTQVMILESKSEIFEKQRAEIRGLKSEVENIFLEVQELKKVEIDRTEKDKEYAKKEGEWEKEREGEKKEKEEKEKEEEMKNMTIFIPEYNDSTKKVSFSEEKVEKDPEVLKVVYTKLFEKNGKKEGGKDGVWNGYIFDSAIIKDNMVTVNLKGSWKPEGDMSSVSFKKLISSAAFKYPNIYNLVVKENGKVINWCMDDMSDGESGCPDKPQHWIEAR